MVAVLRPPATLQQINEALQATKKRRDGQNLSRQEKAAASRIQDLFKDVLVLKDNAALLPTLKSVIDEELASLGQVPANPILSQHLKLLCGHGMASDAAVAQTKVIAGRLSHDEDELLNLSLARMVLGGEISGSGYSDISAYIDQERIQRSRFERSQKLKRGLLKTGAIAAGAVLLPLAFWVPAVGGVLAVKLGVVATQLLQGGSAAVGMLAGGFLGGRINRGLIRAPDSYGTGE